MRANLYPLLASLLAAASVCTTANAAPGFKNGNSLFEDCQDEQSAACLEYVVGATDMLSLIQALRLKESPLYCQPKGVTGAQVQSIVVRYLRDKPEQRHLAAASSVAMALIGAFPCPDQAPSPRP